MLFHFCFSPAAMHFLHGIFFSIIDKDISQFLFVICVFYTTFVFANDTEWVLEFVKILWWYCPLSINILCPCLILLLFGWSQSHDWHQKLCIIFLLNPLPTSPSRLPIPSLFHHGKANAIQRLYKSVTDTNLNPFLHIYPFMA